MAFGFPAKYTLSYSLNSSTPKQFFHVAMEAAKKLGWSISTKDGSMEFSASTKFSILSWFELITVKIENTTAIMESKCGGSQIFDWGKNQQNIEKLVVAIEELKRSIVLTESFQAIEESNLNTTGQESTISYQSVSEKKNKVGTFFSFFRPSKDFFITPIIIDLNTAVFIAMVISGVGFFLPDNLSLLKWGANFQPVTLSGEWWRLFTCMFLHIGVFHLLMNMYAFLYIGLLLEPYLGKLRFASAYLLTGIAASVTSLWWNTGTICAGASGAIFGMYGVFLAMLTTNIIDKSTRKPLLISIAVFVVYNLLNGMKAGIDNAAHIGGLLSGIIIGYAFYPSLKKPNRYNLKYITVGLLTFFTIYSAFAAYCIIPNDIPRYQIRMAEFEANEAAAINEVYKAPRNLPNDSMAIRIDQGLNLWEENLKIINSLSDLRLSDKANTMAKTLKRYCNMRINSYKLIYEWANRRGDTVILNQINIYGRQIDALVDSIKAKSN